jgi:four helix bundle protein
VNPKAAALLKRTRAFFRRVIAFTETLPRTPAAKSISLQLIDSAGSTDSNYRSACKARSRKEFIAKVGVAAEEAFESQGWLEALAEASIGEPRETKELIQEANELTAIFVASQKTAKRNSPT